MKIPCSVVAVALLLWPSLAAGQPNTCGGLSHVDDSQAKLVYPAIAKAAHVSGVVLLLVTFQQDGAVQQVEAVSGPIMLRASAADFARAWRVNTYTGPRTCPIAITYVLDGIAGPTRGVDLGRTDPQHVAISSGVPLVMYQRTVAGTDPQHWEVHGDAPCLCDPAAEIHRKRRFAIF